MVPAVDSVVRYRTRISGVNLNPGDSAFQVPIIDYVHDIPVDLL